MVSTVSHVSLTVCVGCTETINQSACPPAPPAQPASVAPGVCAQQLPACVRWLLVVLHAPPANISFVCRRQVFGTARVIFVTCVTLIQIVDPHLSPQLLIFVD